MLRKIMIVSVAGVGFAVGLAADASARMGSGGGGGHTSGCLGGNHRSLCHGQTRLVHLQIRARRPGGLDHDRNFDHDRSFNRTYGYWDDHGCSYPYYYNAYGSWNGFGCYPAH